MSWRRFDTLFLRLFLLMWITLVGSHYVSFTFSTPPRGEHDAATRELPPMPSLPPGGLFEVGRPGGGLPPDGPRMEPPGAQPGSGAAAPGLPRGALWADYVIRALLIALGAAVGARWLAAPMRRLSAAAEELSEGLAHGRPAPRLEESSGTREVRETARLFNAMAARLQQQFDARSLHMAALSHDLRTPLTRMRLRLERLGDAQASAAVADLHEMDEMIDDTLAVMREQRDAEPARPIDAVALLQALVDDHADQGHDVTLTPPVGPLRVRAHPAALRRVIGNLVGNALRYGERARVGARARDGEVEIHVDDDGPGLPPERIEQAFEPWVRLPDGTARADHGHGIGLAIARELAQRDGGRLTLANRPEGGLRAVLLLPSA